MRTPVIAGNWKMNTTPSTAVELARGVAEGTSGVQGVARIVFPPSVCLPAVKDAVDGTEVEVGAQNVHFEPPGAFTGELSIEMLDGLASHVIVGHSERRSLFGETDAGSARKVAAVSAAGLKPILCIGEALDERKAGRAETFCRAQLRDSLEGFSDWDVLTVAYEPVWAIGTGEAASPQIAQAMAAAIRNELAALAGQPAAERIPILYGGSVNAVNAGPFIDRPDIDGALVGGASLDAEEFSSIVRLTAGLSVR